MRKIGKFEAFDKLITEKNAAAWAEWCGGNVVSLNGNVGVEFMNKYNCPQVVKVGGIILRYTEDEQTKYIGTSTENLNKVAGRA